MANDFIARASVTINAPADRVWGALTDPVAIKQYMFGSTVTTDWKRGNPITWKGEFEGKAYEDKGIILEIEPERLLEYSHFSPKSGAEDRPMNYHHVTIELFESNGHTRVVLMQDKNATVASRAEAEKNWNVALQGLKSLVEARSLAFKR